MVKNNARNPGERGQMLILFVLALGVLCGFVALSVDVGLILHERRQLQNTADAAALAGAQELHNSAGAAIAMAQQYAVANGIDLTDPDYSFQATTPYQGDSGKIEVKVSRQVGFLFGRVLGLDFVNVPGRAVAEQGSSASVGFGYAIFASNSDCGASDPLEISGANNDVTGQVHSNSTVQVKGSNNTFNGPVTHSCGFENSGEENIYNPPPASVPVQPSPLDYEYSDFPCTQSWSGDIDLNAEPSVWLNDDPKTNQLKDGVYCATGKLLLSDQNISGNVTLVSQFEVDVAGSNFNLNGYYDDVLIYSAGSHEAAADLSGSGGTWTGLIYAPYGKVKFQGQGNLSVVGSIVADKVGVSGSNFSIDATGFEVPSTIPGAVRLIE